MTRCLHGHRIGLPWVACMCCKPHPDSPGVVLNEPPSADWRPAAAPIVGP